MLGFILLNLLNSVEIEDQMENLENRFAGLIEHLSIDVSGPWEKWDWRKVHPVDSYDFACLEEYRDSIFITYRLYNSIGLAHIRRVLSGASKNSSILDAGGGTGRKAVPLAVEGFKEITLLDLAEGWIELARKKVEQEQVRDSISFLQGDITDLSGISDATFDFVFAMGGVVSYCKRPKHAFSEVFRVLRKDGVFLADGLHSRIGSLKFLAKRGNIQDLEAFCQNNFQNNYCHTFDTMGLKSMAESAGFGESTVFSEFTFLPEENLRISSSTSDLEKALIDLEMKFYRDPQTIGASGLAIEAGK